MFFVDSGSPRAVLSSYGDPKLRPRNATEITNNIGNRNIGSNVGWTAEEDKDIVQFFKGDTKLYKKLYVNKDKEVQQLLLWTLNRDKDPLETKNRNSGELDSRLQELYCRYINTMENYGINPELPLSPYYAYYREMCRAFPYIVDWNQIHTNSMSETKPLSIHRPVDSINTVDMAGMSNMTTLIDKSIDQSRKKNSDNADRVTEVKRQREELYLERKRQGKRPVQLYDDYTENKENLEPAFAEDGSTRNPNIALSELDLGNIKALGILNEEFEGFDASYEHADEGQPSGTRTMTRQADIEVSDGNTSSSVGTYFSENKDYQLFAGLLPGRHRRRRSSRVKEAFKVQLRHVFSKYWLAIPTKNRSYEFNLQPEGEEKIKNLRLPRKPHESELDYQQRQQQPTNMCQDLIDNSIEPQKTRNIPKFYDNGKPSNLSPFYCAPYSAAMDPVLTSSSLHEKLIWIFDKLNSIENFQSMVYEKIETMELHQQTIVENTACLESFMSDLDIRLFGA